MGANKKLSQENNSLKNMLNKILKEICVVGLVIFLVGFALELIKEGFVSNHFDLNIFLMVILLSGLGWVFLEMFKKN